MILRIFGRYRLVPVLLCAVAILVMWYPVRFLGFQVSFFFVVFCPSVLSPCLFCGSRCAFVFFCGLFFFCTILFSVYTKSYVQAFLLLPVVIFLIFFVVASLYSL